MPGAPANDALMHALDVASYQRRVPTTPARRRPAAGRPATASERRLRVRCACVVRGAPTLLGGVSGYGRGSCCGGSGPVRFVCVPRVRLRDDATSAWLSHGNVCAERGAGGLRVVAGECETSPRAGCRPAPARASPAASSACDSRRPQRRCDIARRGAGERARQRCGGSGPSQHMPLKATRSDAAAPGLAGAAPERAGALGRV